MIDIYDSETLVKVYGTLSKKCESIDKFIENYAYHFGNSGCEFGASDVCDSIIQLMGRKNQLINLKIILDETIKLLNERDKKIILIKMNYNLSILDCCLVLNLKERTAFRYLERAFKNLTIAINNSKYLKKLEEILQNEIWISKYKEHTKTRRLNYKTALYS